jgi:cbb3-type cytochrome oxidase subunit 3
VKLSDVMGAANLAIYAEVGLLIFFLVFVLIVWRLLRKNTDWEHARRLPLDDDDPPAEEDLRRE